MSLALIECGTLENTTTGTSLVLTLTTAAPAGATLLLTYKATTSVTFTDSSSNTWTLAGSPPTAYSAADCLAIGVGGTITFTLSNPNAYPQAVVAALYAVTGSDVQLTGGDVEQQISTSPPQAIDLTNSNFSVPRKHRLALALVDWSLPDQGIKPNVVGTYTINSAEFTVLENYLRQAGTFVDTLGTTRYYNVNLAAAYFNKTNISEAPNYESDLNWTQTAEVELASWNARFLQFYEEDRSAGMVRARTTKRRVVVRAEPFAGGVDGTIVADRYDESDTFIETVTVETTTTCRLPRLAVRGDGVLTAVYRIGSAVRARISRDEGSTWPVASTVATSAIVYSLIAFAWATEAAIPPFPVAMLYRGDTQKWYVTVGNTALTSWTVPRDIGVSADGAQGDLKQRSDGVWEFLYLTLAGDWVVVQCFNLGYDGVGTWA